MDNYTEQAKITDSDKYLSFADVLHHDLNNFPYLKTVVLGGGGYKVKMDNVDTTAMIMVKDKGLYGKEEV